jgi:hypothetical protein
MLVVEGEWDYSVGLAGERRGRPDRAVGFVWWRARRRAATAVVPGVAR